MSFKRYNDGVPVEQEHFTQTRRELVSQLCPDRMQGIWSSGGRTFEDANIKVVIDVEDTGEVQLFFQRFKETLKSRFQQIEIWIISYPIQIH